MSDDNVEIMPLGKNNRVSSWCRNYITKLRDEGQFAASDFLEHGVPKQFHDQVRDICNTYLRRKRRK